MKFSAILLSLGLVASPAISQPASDSASRPPPQTSSRWSINVLGLKGEPLGSFKIELLEEDTDTCMSGHWKKARLIQSSFQLLTQTIGDKAYFPTYEANGEKLTIQLNPPRLCDAYVMLEGKFTKRKGKGEYFGMGLGRVDRLGTFTAEKQQP